MSDADRTLSAIQRQQAGRTLPDACHNCRTSRLYCDAHQWMRDQAPCCGSCSH